MSAPSRLRVLIADASAAARAGLRATLAGDPDVTIVGEARDVPALQLALHAAAPDVALIDLAFLVPRGGALLRALAERWPSTRVVATSSLEGESAIAAVLAAGAHVHLRKDAFRDELMELLHHGDRRKREVRKTEPLTWREAEILRRVARGETGSEIATALSSAVGTVESEMRLIQERLGAGDPWQAALAAVRRGLIRL